MHAAPLAGSSPSPPYTTIRPSPTTVALWPQRPCGPLPRVGAGEAGARAALAAAEEAVEGRLAAVVAVEGAGLARKWLLLLPPVGWVVGVCGVCICVRWWGRWR